MQEKSYVLISEGATKTFAGSNSIRVYPYTITESKLKQAEKDFVKKLSGVAIPFSEDCHWNIKKIEVTEYKLPEEVINVNHIRKSH